jgi:hypothetical protein
MNTGDLVVIAVLLAVLAANVTATIFGARWHQEFRKWQDKHSALALRIARLEGRGKASELISEYFPKRDLHIVKPKDVRGGSVSGERATPDQLTS